ncbi:MULTISPECIES: hypothetical protein [unclassified Rhizobium]|uniref:hypothetical protein n=1 Tax=unclassified Rhizobium TaxID=2613769 RepID=UPI003812121D
MAMDQYTLSLIEQSLDQLDPVSDGVDTMFAHRLLDAYPDVYRLFAIDLEPQARKLLPTLRLMVDELPRFGALLPSVRALAYSRKICRMVDAHYQPISETLLWTLRRSLGCRFTNEVERAWRETLLMQ